MTDPIELHKEALSIAVELGYTGPAIASFASRLRGETAEELRADAAELAKIMTPAKPKPAVTPNESFNEWGAQARLFSD